MFCNIILSEKVSAASFESMKENVNNGEGLVYNPISEGFMTETNSKEYVEIIEEKLLEKQEAKEDILPKVMAEAYAETQDLEVLPSETLPEPPAIMGRGANIPVGNIRYLDLNPMPNGSAIFSGSGWRYSGYKFFFNNIRANPYFGVAVTGDSFYFHNIYGRKDPVYPGYTYYFPTVPPHGGISHSTYFSTLNPVYGSKYYIW